MKPTEKALEIEKLLEDNFGRTSAITTNKCIPKPIGCGEPIKGFRDSLSQREYAISGLCQKCQDSIFGK